MSLINVTNLTFAYDGSYDNIFENVSFQINVFIQQRTEEEGTDRKKLMREGTSPYLGRTVKLY